MAPDPAALWPLLIWASPGFPIGSYAHSHGLEWAVESGDVTDAASLLCWCEDVIAHGAGRSDAILAAHAHRAWNDTEALSECADLAAALAPARERQVETLAQGAAFLRALAAWPAAQAAAARAGDANRLSYPVAFGAACGAADIRLDDALTGYLSAFATMLVSAAVRLVPLGQSDGLRVLAGLTPLALRVASEASDAPLDAIGGACFRADIAAMRHETQYTRLFRS